MIVWSSRHSPTFDFVLIGVRDKKQKRSLFQNAVASFCVTGNRIGNVQGLGGGVCMTAGLRGTGH